MNQATENRAIAGGFPTEIRERSGPAAKIYPWLPAIERGMVAILAVVLVTSTLVPGWQALRSEFPNYYLAAELFHQRIPLDRIYEWTWFQRQNDHLGVRQGLVSFAPNPPTSILPLLPFTTLTPLSAKRLWLVLSLGFLALALTILRHTTSLAWRRLILIALLCIFPLHVDLEFGRPYAFILFLICVAYYAAFRKRQWAAGAVWSAAAAMKLFPALSVILFFRRRNWRAVFGFVTAGVLIATVSTILFGAEVHRVFLREVLSQASRGDWLGPYALSQNSFTTLWGHLFLIEPELNPSPWINSATLYAVAMAVSVAALVIGFLWSTSGKSSPRSMALHWSALLPLLVLLSSTSAPDYSCILIFSAAVGLDALLVERRKKIALALLALYVVVCAPVPIRITNWFPIYRLVATTALYGLLLCAAADHSVERPMRNWFAAGFVLVVALTLFNLHNLRDRTEDFSNRLPGDRTGYRSADPHAVAGGIAFTDMQPNRYAVEFLNGAVQSTPVSSDALSIAGSPGSGLLYAELTGYKSFIVRYPLEREATAPNTLTGGQDPSLSANGKWLAFIREDRATRTAWLMPTDSPADSQRVLPDTYQPLDLTVTNGGDVIAAAGAVSNPGVLLVRHQSQDIAHLSDLGSPIRYPAISADGLRLAFSRREGGFWHLFVRNLATGHEQQLTHAFCNAISPSWENTQTLLYATDCGRGIGLSALARVVVLPH